MSSRSKTSKKNTPSASLEAVEDIPHGATDLGLGAVGGSDEFEDLPPTDPADVTQQLLKLLISERRDSSRKAPKIKAPKAMAEDEDVLEFLDLFEDNMEARGVEREQWASHLIPLLNRKCRITIATLGRDQKRDYDAVIAAVATTNSDVYLHPGPTFFTLQKKAGEMFHTYASKLHRLCQHFTDADTIEGCQEKVTIERFLQTLPYACQSNVRDRQPKTLHQVCQFAEEYFGNHRMSIEDYIGDGQWKGQQQQSDNKSYNQQRRFGRDYNKKSYQQASQEDVNKPQPQHQQQTQQLRSVEELNPTKEQQRQGGGRQFRCYTCGQSGHTPRNCPQKVNLVTALTQQEQQSTSCLVEGLVGDKQVRRILVDTGAEGACVAEDVLPQELKTKGTTVVAGATGEPVKCDLNELPLTVHGRSFKVEAAVLPRGLLKYGVLLGRNTPGLKVHWNIGPEPNVGEKSDHDVCVVRTRAQAKREEEEEKRLEQLSKESKATPRPLEDSGDLSPTTLPPSPTHTNFPTSTTHTLGVEGKRKTRRKSKFKSTAPTTTPEGTAPEPTWIPPELPEIQAKSPLAVAATLTREEISQRQKEDPTLTPLFSLAAAVWSGMESESIMKEGLEV